ncbi:hypothetical protein T484DRAFT_1914564 [Baffinella frigidus]|nr:hypothetical protein T484DRAFT_1914564 [Cryptophyta sp. CCMP2293]
MEGKRRALLFDTLIREHARPGLLARVREALTEGKRRATLFDTPAFALRMETLLRMQWEVFSRAPSSAAHLHGEAVAEEQGGGGGAGGEGEGGEGGGAMHVVHNQAALDVGFRFERAFGAGAVQDSL